MKLVVVEFQQEVEFLTEHHPHVFQGDVKVIALLPEACALLKKKGIAFETSLPYFSKRSHEDCLTSVARMIRVINDAVRIQDTYGLKNAYINALTFCLRPYLGYFVNTLEVLNNAFERHSVTQLHVCCYEGNDQSGYAILAKERILGNLAKDFKDRLDVCLYPLDLPASVKPMRWKNFFKTVFCSLMFFVEMARLGKFQHQPIVFYSLKYYFVRIALDFKGHDLFNVAPDIKSYTKLVDTSSGAVLNQVHIGDAAGPEDKIFDNSWREAMKCLNETHASHRLFSFRDYDFSSFVFQKCSLGFGPELKKLNRRVGLLKRFYSVLKPAVVLSPMSRDFSYALGELAQRMGIGSVLISHGSHVPPKNHFDRMEWFDHGKGLVHTDYRYHLLQSPWAVEHVRAMGYQGNYYKVEPLIFPTVDRHGKEALQLKMYPQSRDKKIVVHAGTPKQRGANRFYIYETLDEYIANICDLVEAVRSIPEIFLVIRFRPLPYLSTAQLKTFLPKGDHYVIATEGGFADYLKIMDLLVSFSSTTIEEALINGIPVVQYDPSGRYVHIQGPAWQDKGFAHVDSVYYIGERRGLGAGLKWVLDNHLNATTVGDLFERHVFKDGEAMTIQQFVERLVKNDLPKPIDLKAKPHLDGVEMF